MKRMVRAMSGVLVGAVLCSLGTAPAFGKDELCPMSGVLVKAEVDKDKALDWAKGRRNVAILAVDSDAWAVVTLSEKDKDFGILLGPEGVFFGLAGKGRELGERDLERAFGRDLRTLREVVKREIGDLWKDRVVKIDGGDPQAISDAVGLGTLEKKGRDWALTASDCKGLEIDVSEVK